MSANAAELKAQLRRTLREEAKRFSPAERAAASAQMCQRLTEQNRWKRAQSVLFFYPMPDEPDIRCLFPAALAGGKATAFPRYSSADQHYVACQVHDLARDLRPGTFGIHEPAVDCPIFDRKKLDLVLVPGVGFALNGFRLGRGKGYYDRLLAEISGFKCGVAFEWQLAVEIPAESHDICLDCILTPTHWHEVTGRRRF
jgi:5-formyltetrahydrofolate cyclo-ligase